MSEKASVPTPTPGAALPVWICDFKEIPGGEAMNSLTVGSKFALNCHGDIPVEWKASEPLTLSYKTPEQQYSLNVLKVEKLEPQDAQFIVTSYKAGKHQPEYIRFQRGGSGFEMAKPSWEVKSVLKPNEKPQPFGPFGPFDVALPLWILIAAILVSGLLIFAVVQRSRKGLQRRRMLEDLKRHRTAMSPLHQFYRDARTLRKRLDNVKVAEELKTITEDLNRDFRLYVLRQFEIPTLDWADAAILKDLRRRHRKIWLTTADPLRKTLRELLRLKGQPSVLLKDVEQLHRMSVDTAERLQRAREEAGR